MLDMFKRPTDPPEYPWLYTVPAVAFTGGFIAAASTGMAGLVQAGYLASSLLCIGEHEQKYSPQFVLTSSQVQSVALLHKQLPDRATCSECSALELVSSRL